MGAEVHCDCYGIWYWCNVEYFLFLFSLPLSLTQPSAGNYIGYIIAGTVIAAVLLVIAVVIIYIKCYEHKRMGHYSLRDVIKFHARHSAVSTTE